MATADRWPHPRAHRHVRRPRGLHPSRVSNGGLRARPRLHFFALELALVDVALVRAPQLAAGELALVDRVVDLARGNAVADAVQLADRALELEVELLVRLRAEREHHGVDALDRLGRARVEVEQLHARAVDRARPDVQAIA